MVLTPESFTQQTVSNQAANMAPLADEILQQQQGGMGFFHRSFFRMGKEKYFGYLDGFNVFSCLINL